MKIILRGLALLMALLAVANVPTGVDAACATARVRKSWSYMSFNETALYKDALASAMDSGAYIKFVELHTEMMGEREAHRQCMFVYWHRMMLIAYENMLRGQGGPGSRFECVTLPYWDWVNDYNRYINGKCTYFLDCAITLRQLGGVTSSTTTRSVTINGEANSARCVSAYPLNHFCQSSLVSGSQCAKCLPRGNWYNTQMPSEISYASVRNQIFGSTIRTIADESKSVEESSHNMVHAYLGGAMGSFISPSDPVFFSHHAMVDLLHTIFHKCRVGTQKLTTTQKLNNAVSWTQCPRRTAVEDVPGANYNGMDTIVMRTGYAGNNPITASQDSKLKPFFSGVPNQFAMMMDTRDIDPSSYSYSMSGLMSSLYTNCANAPARRLEDVFQQVPARRMEDVYEVAPEKTNLRNLQSNQFIVGPIINPNLDTDAQQYQKWYSFMTQVVTAMGGDASEEGEKLMCLFEDVCHGGVKDYSAEFKKTWKVKGKRRCKKIVDEAGSGRGKPMVAGWKSLMTQFFKCPNPKKEGETDAPTEEPTDAPTDAPSTEAPVPARV